MKDDCIFCKLANGIIPTNQIYEDDDFKVILDTAPANEGHALVLPKEHYENIFQINEGTLAKSIVLAKKVAEKMQENLQCDGVNLVQNNKEAAGQTVPHFHIHVIPRYSDDGQKINWTPREVSDDTFKKMVEKLTL